MPELFGALPRATQRFCAACVLLYLATAAWALPHTDPGVAAGLTAIFAATGLVRPVASPFGGITDPNIGVIIVAALLWRPPEVLLGVGIGSFIGLLAFRRTELWRAAINGAGWGLPAAASAAAAQLVSPAAPRGIAPLILGAAIAVATYRSANTAIFAAYRSTRFGRPLMPEWLQTMAFQWPSQLLSAPLAVVLALVSDRADTTWAGLGFTGLYVVALPLARQEYAYYNRSREMLDETVEAVVRALEGADPGAREHGDRVSALAAETGRRLGMSEHRLTALRLAALLHDVGLLAGQDAETPEEHHAAIGGRVLAQFPDPLIGEFVRGHHERWDGEGLPGHLRGAAIPLGSRILAAAELYDTARAGLGPFGGPRSHEEAAEYLASLAGTVLDPRVVTALLQAASDLDSPLTGPP